jgi:O-methyltransferase
MSWKTNVRKLINKMGYQIQKYPAMAVGEYSLCYPWNYPIYTPWFEKWFQDMYGPIRDHTLVTEDRCYMIHKFARYCTNIEGDFAECGVYKGGTAFLLALSMTYNSCHDRNLYLFDTFAGMPAFANEDPSGHKEGSFGGVSLDAVTSYLQKFSFVVFQPGIFPETFDLVKERKFAFVHIDVDLYQSAMDCCSFFYSRMSKGGVMIFDDYGFPQYKLAERRAVDEFFEDKPESPIALNTGQAFIIKL